MNTARGVIMPHMKRKWMLVLLVTIAAVFVLRWPYLSMGFWGDDIDFQLALNRMPLRDIGALWSSHWGWVYRPIFLTYFWLMREGFTGIGPGIASLFVWNLSSVDAMNFQASAPVMHAANLLMHSGTVFLLGVLAYRLTRDKWIAILAGVVFVLYPQKEHAVQWISCASILLACLFSLLCLNLWLSYLSKPSKLLYLGCLLSFALALGSKEEALMLPPLLAVLTLHQKRRPSLPHFAPFALLLIGYLCLSWTSANYAQAHPRFDWQSGMSASHGDVVMVWLQFYARALLMPLDLLMAGTRLLEMNGAACGQSACLVFDFITALPRMAQGIACAVIIAGVGLMCRRSTVALLALLWCAVATLVMAALVGSYVLGSEFPRFFYAPALSVSLLWAMGLRAVALQIKARISSADKPQPASDPRLTATQKT